MKKVKLSLKQLLSNNINACFQEFEALIHSTSLLFDDLIQLQNRFNRLQEEHLSALVTDNDYEVKYNQIVNSLLYLINKLQASDCTESYPEEGMSVEMFSLKENERLLLEQINNSEGLSAEELKDLEAQLMLCRAGMKKLIN